MLHLKRASAGSGKTYELAKTYIRLLISSREAGRQRRLRPLRTLSSALPSIMAVTFTVKATDEMKSRIVEKLAALASASSISDPGILAKIDYLEDFKKEFKADKDAIAESARGALRVLLLNYSDFKVSTIDSFFQSILHTFAYEVNLDDTFNLEIDSEYVASMGLNAALDAIAAAQEGDEELLHWFRELMNDSSGTNQWNIFQRRDTSRSLYSQLIKNSNELEKEQFKTIRRELEDYFESLPDIEDSPVKGNENATFVDVVKAFDTANINEWKELHERRGEVARKFEDAINSIGYPLDGMCQSYGASYLRGSMEEFDPYKPYDKYFKKLSKKAGFSLSKATQDHIKSGANPTGITSVNDPRIAYLDSILEEWNDLSVRFNELIPKIKLWRLYRDMLPLLRIVMEVSRLKREYLEATNSLAISDTNSILKTIIGEEDTPFIYERMGSRINHYLIDEFQDTSRMQWDNFYPLLKESVDQGYDDLIIGDAKQSIYRFRNADYSLISKGVERQFEGQIILSADDVVKDPARENTNYRSMVNIVDFNNKLFSALTEEGHYWSETMESLRDIYSDCVQAVPDKIREKGLGYVEINLYPALKGEEKEGEDKVGYVSLANPGFKNLPRLILSLKERGYDFRDIGILARSNDEGNGVVRVISEHNSANPSHPIPMISEESLLLKNSSAVRLILYALEIGAKGPRNVIPDNPVLKEPVDEGEVYKLLNSLQSMALPSVVEAVISRFIPRDHPDLAYIAAFQDAVLDYSSNHSSDIGSFLRWWDKKAGSLAIATPEESDGVRILTVHKSKGLQYRCVIMPYLKYSFEPSGSQNKEWRWVRPDASLAGTSLLPPFIPLDASKNLKGTPHEKVYDEFCRDVALDALNGIYVGFTRAIDELYVFADLKNRNGHVWAPNIIGDIVRNMKGVDLEPYHYKESITDGDEEKSVSESTLDIVEEGEEESVGETLKFGRPLTSEEIDEQKIKDQARNRREVEDLDFYESNFQNDLLQVKDAQTTVGMLAEEDEEADSEETDPRSEGNRKHQLLEWVVEESDLEKALRRMLVRGMITLKEADIWRIQLEEALVSVREYGWFDASNRVLNERNIIQYRHTNRRPDRVVVRPDGSAVVIDYKFGDERKEHYKQISGYRTALLESGQFTGVDAYLWYVTEGKVKKIE